MPNAALMPMRCKVLAAAHLALIGAMYANIQSPNPGGLWPHIVLPLLFSIEVWFIAILVGLLSRHWFHWAIGLFAIQYLSEYLLQYWMPSDPLLAWPALTRSGPHLGSVVCLWIYRCSIRHVGHEQIGDEPAAIQFTIKRLLCGISLVAVLLAIKALIWNESNERETFGRVNIQIAISISQCLTTVTLVWAVFGNGRLRIRLPCAIAAGTVAGMLPNYYLSLPLSIPIWIYFTAAPILLTPSLLVLRSCGYRLPRRLSAPAVPSDGRT